ncbi:MAG TPA: 50S ribosomal protein L9 [Aquificae bacterium]|nr:50S ribosomal protein L9 [Aquificota bacterium]
MKVILLKNMEHLGEVGKIVNVKPGYARNYLIPKGIALPATEENIRKVKNMLKSLQEKAKRELEKYKKLAEELGKVQITIEHEVAEEGKLYGSVTKADIEKALHKLGFKDIDKGQIKLEKPIKEVGSLK